jgi:ABC-type taurine transport system ATPase subunit
MNVADNVAYGLKVKRVPARERSERADQALAMVNVVVLFVLAITVVPVTLAQRLTRDTGVLRGVGGRAAPVAAATTPA